MVALSVHPDPTLAELDRLHQQAALEPPRPYLGASSIGQPCERRLWYGFRWALDRTSAASGYRAIQDGHRGERVMADWLRAIPGLTLWTEDPEAPDRQIGFQALAGHFRGSLDGIIQGLKQAPKTPHVWECKVVNETKFNRLRKLILEQGEKQALAAWDEVYFAQAQVYMHALELTRHYLTVCTPGNRAILSCRTAYQSDVARALYAKAERIIVAARPPLKLSDDPAFWQCKWCDFHALCHSSALPEVNCRTCAHSTAQIDDRRPWLCELQRCALPETLQRQGCPKHAFHPDLMANHATPIHADPQTGAITFRFEDGSTWVNGIAGTKSADWRQEQASGTAKIPDGFEVPEVPEVPEELAALAAESGLSETTLQTADFPETQWPVVFDAATRMFDRFLAGSDERRCARLRALMEQIDGAYLALMERTRPVAAEA